MGFVTLTELAALFCSMAYYAQAGAVTEFDLSLRSKLSKRISGDEVASMVEEIINLSVN